jgi:hypothetical protein
MHQNTVKSKLARGGLRRISTDKISSQEPILLYKNQGAKEKLKIAVEDQRILQDCFTRTSSRSQISKYPTRAFAQAPLIQGIFKIFLGLTSASPGRIPTRSFQDLLSRKEV